MHMQPSNIETLRLDLQQRLDSQRTQIERNKLGQFATPLALAQEIIKFGLTLLPTGEGIHFLDPAFGTGAFYSALLNVADDRLQSASGYEIDPHYGNEALLLWADTPLRLQICDFTKETPLPKSNFLICNPPYVRHHHLTANEKSRLQKLSIFNSGVRISGLAGLYCHFLAIAHQWMAPGAIAGWLIPSEFMDVNYGTAIKSYLLQKVTLLRIHRFAPNDVQFSDALVSSAIVWIRNQPAPQTHSVEFSFGGPLNKPTNTRSVPRQVLVDERKWSRFPLSAVRPKSPLPKLSDFFRIKRGLATGDNSFFILSAEQIAAKQLPLQFFRRILPSPRHILTLQIEADPEGNPLIPKRLFLLDSEMAEEEIRVRFPVMWKYLKEGKERGVHERYLCSRRKPWYSQEKRPPAPLICTYIGRTDTPSGKPFRFIRNHSQATVGNVYLAMYPSPKLLSAALKAPETIDKIWTMLNALDPQRLLSEGRVYGGGLHKLEPRELGNLPIERELFPSLDMNHENQANLFAA